MIPWSHGCSTLVVFGGRNTKVIAFNRRMFRIIINYKGNAATFQFYLSSFLTQSSKIDPAIHALEFALYSVSSVLMFFRHLGFLNFPMMMRGNFSVPLILAATSKVIRSLGTFTPVPFFPSKPTCDRVNI